MGTNEIISTSSYINSKKGGKFNFTLLFKNRWGLDSNYPISIDHESHYRDVLSMLRIMSIVEWRAKTEHTFKVDLGGKVLLIPSKDIDVKGSLSSIQIKQ